jgi:hypothetical protein
MQEPTVLLTNCAEAVMLYLAATADLALVKRRNTDAQHSLHTQIQVIVATLILGNQQVEQTFCSMAI